MFSSLSGGFVMASAGGSLTRRRVSVKLFFVALAMPYLAQCGKGVYYMLNVIISFVVSVVAGIVANYISKWLDR